MGEVSIGAMHEIDLERFARAVLYKRFIGHAELCSLFPAGASSLPSLSLGVVLKKLIKNSLSDGQNMGFVLCPNNDSRGRPINVKLLEEEYRRVCKKELIFRGPEGFRSGGYSLYTNQIFEVPKWMFFTNNALRQSNNTDCFVQTSAIHFYVLCVSAGMSKLPSMDLALDEFNDNRADMEKLFGSATFEKGDDYVRSAMEKLFSFKLNTLFRPTAEMVIYYLAVMLAVHGYNPLADGKFVCTRSLSPRGRPIRVGCDARGVIISEGAMFPISNTGTWVSIDPTTLVSLQ